MPNWKQALQACISKQRKLNKKEDAINLYCSSHYENNFFLVSFKKLNWSYFSGGKKKAYTILSVF